MPKRPYPYVEDYIPQSKTHVGIKQFNNNKDRMQKIYEKTLHLLFKGAKKPQESIKISDIVPLARKNCMKQLSINKDGSLGCSTITDSGKHCTIQPCICGSQLVETKCWYCEVSLCAACNRPCARCHLVFCSKCSIHGSEGTQICVSCYG